MIPERIAAKIDFEGICWEWRAGLIEGYGAAWWSGKVQRAHRVIWELLVGPIPAALVLDHWCRNHRCVNPDHLEPVTSRSNTLRGYGATAQHARKTQCPSGHAYTLENTRVYRGKRYCRACQSKWRRSTRPNRKVIP